MIVFSQSSYINDCINILNLKNNLVIFNLSSFITGQGIENITELLLSSNYILPQESVYIGNGFTHNPINITEYINSVKFDMDYYNFIINNPRLFIYLMKIMINCYEGTNVLILIERDEYRDAITESLIKLIQSRYGYNCWLINEVEDLYSIRESKFNPLGLMQLDEDRARYMALLVNDSSNTPLIGEVPSDWYDQ